MKSFAVFLSFVAVGALLAGSVARVSPVRAQSGVSNVPLSQALSNAKQLGLVCVMKAADSGGVYKIGPTTFKSDVGPYLQNLSAFTSPLDKPGTQSFQFNKALQNVPQKKIKKPADTVMVYEGAWGKPSFRYNGMAVIVFADGHAKQFSPALAKGLLWKP